MRRRWLGATVLALWFVVVGRDWFRHPAIVELGGVERIVATGDVHGGADELRASLREAGVVSQGTDGTWHWSGARTVWVATGDYCDRGEQSREVFEFIAGMQPQAAAAGGRVVALMGNHEAMLVGGDVWDRAQNERRRRVRERPYGATVDSLTKGGRDFQYEVGPRGAIGRFIRRLPLMAVVNGRFGFLHAGLGTVRSRDELSRAYRRCVDGELWNDAFLSPTTDAAAAASPLWARDWWDDGTHVTALLAALGVRELVFGHTPWALCDPTLLARHAKIERYLEGQGAQLSIGRRERLEQRLSTLARHLDEQGGTVLTDASGRLFNVDVGMSPWYAMSRGGCLEIVVRDGAATFRAIQPGKPSRLLKADPYRAAVVEGREESPRR